MNSLSYVLREAVYEEGDKLFTEVKSGMDKRAVNGLLCAFGEGVRKNSGVFEGYQGGRLMNVNTKRIAKAILQKVECSDIEGFV